MARLFFSYSHADEGLRDRLELSLTMLKRQGILEVFHDRRIPPGDEIDHSINDELQRADVILLLVSPEFLASSYCYDVEMQRALQRHEAGEARIIPVILRPCEWKYAPFAKIMATPLDGKAVTQFPDLDVAFLDVTSAIRQALEGSRSATLPPPLRRAGIELSGALPSGPRSSNLRLPRTFSDVDKDRFRDEAFEYVAKFFENSLQQLAERNVGIEVNFKRIDANQFTAVSYKNGRKASWCRIFTQQPMMGEGIAFSASEHISTGSFNESLTVTTDQDGIYLKPLGMSMRVAGSRLTFEGAAEVFWDMFIERMRH